MQKTLALIFGGEGAERRISELSAASVAEKIREKLNFITIGITSSGDWFLYEGDISEIESGEWLNSDKKTPVFPARFNGIPGFYTNTGELIKSDIAFPILHGDFGEDGIIQGALRCAHISYIGSDVLPSAITSDKAFTKIIAEYLGIPTLPWFIPTSQRTNDVRREAERRLGYPIFIKPRELGSSIGAFPVYSRREFNEAFDTAQKLSNGKIMIESLADVELELELALFDNGKIRFISPPGAICSSGKFYSFSAKYGETESPKTALDAKLDRSVIRSARSMARRISDFLGLGNISRIDFFLTPSGEIYFNEINSIPGMTKTSLYPSLAELYGRFGNSFVEVLTDSGLLK
ncbi:MAG: D-alanine--D-alanine ligase [Clostridia bacterium]|nr:D-alanine--D-alanine ligase [Clostridia bacterium]